jgi:hypothetical protein
MQVHASETTVKNVRAATGTDRLTEGQRATFQLHESYFGAALGGYAF